MARNNLGTFRVVPVRGLNPHTDLAEPGELKVARNVWAPNGKVVRRPGFYSYKLLDPETLHFPAGLILGTQDTPTGIFTWQAAGNLALNVDVGDYWYFGFTEDPSGLIGMRVSKPAGNTNIDPYRAAEYSAADGSWKTLTSTYTDDAAETAYIGNVGAFANESFIPPGDWATRSIEIYTRYWIRFRILGGGLLAGTTISTINSAVSEMPVDAEINMSEFAEFPFGSYVCYAYSLPKSNAVGFIISQPPPYSFPVLTDQSIAEYQYSSDKSTMAVVPMFGEAFIANGERAIAFKYSSGAWSGDIAAVESSASLVGDRGTYSTIARRDDFPKGEFIVYAQERIFVASSDGRVSWSMSGLGYKVFPLLATSQIVEDDDSPITGMAMLGEQVIIFKRDSVWMMVDGGIDAFGITQFSPKKVVIGKGCIAYRSIRSVKGRLIFLGEDGIYAFDGTPNIEKILVNKSGADRLSEVMSRISSGSEHKAAAANWTTHGCYVCSVPLDGSDKNNHVIVWDYERDGLWVWDGFTAEAFFLAEDTKDRPVLYFASVQNGVSRMIDGSPNDHGSSVDVEVEPHPVPYRMSDRQILRYLEIGSGSRVATMPLSFNVDDDEAVVSGDISFAGNSDTGVNKTRNAYVKTRLLGSSFAVNITKSTSHAEDFELRYLEFGFKPMGKR